MGQLTLANFRTDVESALGDRSIGNTRVDRWINAGYLDVTGSVNFETLVNDTSTNTVGSTGTIAIPTDAEIVTFIKDTTNDNLLGWLPKNELFRRDATTEGTATHWTRHADLIYLRPVPSGVQAMFIAYKKSPALLASSGTTTDIPDIWDTAVFLMAVQHALLALGEEQRSASWLARGITYITSRITEEDIQSQAAGLGASIPSGIQALMSRLQSLQGGGGGQ